MSLEREREREREREGGREGDRKGEGEVKPSMIIELWHTVK